jgi:hypothetical protein
MQASCFMLDNCLYYLQLCFPQVLHLVFSMSSHTPDADADADQAKKPLKCIDAAMLSAPFLKASETCMTPKP